MGQQDGVELVGDSFATEEYIEQVNKMPAVPFGLNRTIPNRCSATRLRGFEYRDGPQGTRVPPKR